MTTKTMLFLLLLFGINRLLPAQESTHKKHIVFKAVLTGTGGEKIRGILKGITDTTLLLSNIRVGTHRDRFQHPIPLPGGDTSMGAPQVISYTEIKSIRFQRLHAAGRGALFGAISGIAIGAVIGLASGTDPQNTILRTTAGEKALILAPVGAIVGALIGTIIGASSHRSFEIDGDAKKFAEMQTVLSDFL